MRKKLSVVLAVRNEEANLASCLDSVKNIADETIVVDENSIDKTVAIAKSFGAKVYLEPHHEIFHITKQKALDRASGDWILQLDADEVVTPSLRDEIKKTINMTNQEIEEREIPDKRKWKLFMRHQKLVERATPLRSSSYEGQGVVAFFIPRINLFLGKPLIHAGVYPDAVIRLVKRGKARFPAKSVHEQMEIGGEVSWLFNDLMHNDSPTLRKYLMRLNRYTDLHASELALRHAPKDMFYFCYYTIFKVISLYIRHKGFQDGLAGFLWSAFSAWHFPIAYFKYWTRGSE
jgi:glycosyltransferase involved in cell wall biosynthesis